MDTDKMFLKHKYLTNPEITPEDEVVAAAQILTQIIKGNIAGESEEIEALEKVAEVFETIAKRKSLKQKEKLNNEQTIRLPTRTNALSPRVAEADAQMYTHGPWLHEWRPIQFSLVANDFRVKYVGEENAKHLVNALVEHYEISQDWDMKKYCGLTLEW